MGLQDHPRQRSINKLFVRSCAPCFSTVATNEPAVPRGILIPPSQGE